MGLEILEEFRPITPIRTVVPTVRTTLKHDLGTTTTTTKEVLNEDVVIEEECHTPTSPSQKLPTNPLVCPPAPKKPRVVPRRLKNLDPPFFPPTADDDTKGIPSPSCLAKRPMSFC